MSFISLFRATLAAGFAASLLWAAPAAAEFRVSRGINLDQWVTWPGPDRWNTAEVMENFPEWKKFVSDADLASLRAAGLDFVRMPVDPAVFLVDMDPAREEKLLAQVDEGIDRARAADLKVIVDLHTIPRGDGEAAPGTRQILSSPALLADYRRLIDAVVRRLSRYGADVVAFEPLNEPTLECGSRDREWPELLSDLHAAARAANPAITLVVPGACWGSAGGLVALDPKALHDDNVLWSFHSYEPFMLTHQSASWAGESVEQLADIPYPLSDLNRRDRKAVVDANLRRIEHGLNGRKRREAEAFLVDHAEKLASPRKLQNVMREPFRIVGRWADRNAIPRDRILLGEFGMIRQEYGKEPATKPEWRAAYYRDMIANAEESGFAWSMWSYSGAFGIVDAYGGDRAEPDVMEMVRTLPPR